MWGFYWSPYSHGSCQKMGLIWQLLTADRTSGMWNAGAARPRPVRQKQSQVWGHQRPACSVRAAKPPNIEENKILCRGLRNVCIYRQTHKSAYFKVLILLLWLNLTFLLLLKEIILRQILGSLFLFLFYYSS